MLNNDNQLITRKEDLKQVWEEYIKQTFEDVRTEQHITTTEHAPSILQSETTSVLRNSKNGKAAGPDQIHNEFLKLLNEENNITY